jgi:tetratricopeptide (TPR) repeat protein
MQLKIILIYLVSFLFSGCFIIDKTTKTKEWKIDKYKIQLYEGQGIVGPRYYFYKLDKLKFPVKVFFKARKTYVDFHKLQDCEISFHKSKEKKYVFDICTGSAYRQISCDSKTLRDSETKFFKAEKRGKSGTYQFADLTFDMAECYRQKNDTTCLKWYKINISVIDSAFKYCTKETRENCNRAMGHRGMSSFYLGQYEMAIGYFEKVLGYTKKPEYHYFLGLTYMKIKKWDIAIVELNNFKKFSVDSKDADELIKTCQEKNNK